MCFVLDFFEFSEFLNWEIVCLVLEVLEFSEFSEFWELGDCVFQVWPKKSAWAGSGFQVWPTKTSLAQEEFFGPRRALGSWAKFETQIRPKSTSWAKLETEIRPKSSCCAKLETEIRPKSSSWACETFKRDGEVDEVSYKDGDTDRQCL